MITANALQRVFRIKIGSKMGTAFAIEYMDRQYLVTVRHIVENKHREVEAFLFYDGGWHQLVIKLVGATKGEADIAVFAAQFQLAPTFPFEPSSSDLVLGQQVFFLGFPLGMMGGGEEINRKFPLPLIKGGVVSTLPSKPQKMFWIDGHNNPGFSGGPVIFVPNARPVSISTPYQIAGVISAYKTLSEPVYDKSNNEIGYVAGNTGIILAYDISHAIDLIKANPIGYKINV